MMWAAPRVKLWFRMMMVNVMVWAVVTRTGNVGVAARFFGGEVAKRENGVKGFALELTPEVFNSSLQASPANSAVVLFFAHWCPACQRFMSQYEQVAQLFSGPDAVYRGVLLMAKVDCAEPINKNLCQSYSVKRYPTMFWGNPPATFSLGKGKDITEIDLDRSHMNAQALLDWINNRLQSSYSLDPAIHRKQSVEDSVSGQMSVSIHDIEEATAEAYDIILDNQLVTSGHRAPFAQFFQLLAVHHPSRRCREGSAQILFNLMDAWPSEYILETVDEHIIQEGSEMLADVASLRQLRICGEEFPSKTYKTCNMVTGGYSCGLWYLFHALSVRVNDSESNAAMKAICDFVANFFTCEECRQHFVKMSQNATATVSSRRDLTLWLWRAHNEVNHRLGKEVDAESQSSRFLWPSKAICAECRKGPEKSRKNADEEIEWNEEEVYKFLRNTYGRSIVTAADDGQTLESEGDGASHGKDEKGTTRSVRAPIGAALGIAMVASCCLGVAACCCRVQPKRKRKQIRKR